MVRIWMEVGLGRLWQCLAVLMGVTYSSALGKINTAVKVILGKSCTSPYEWGEMTNFHNISQGGCTYPGTICFSCKV